MLPEFVLGRLPANGEQVLAFGILAATFVLFVWGRWRYDVVALLALLAVVLTGLVPFADAFQGFAHPAVLTVASVLIISRALQNAGIVDVVVKAIAGLRGHENLQLAAQTVAVAILSSFMNNVGALALMLPVALRSAYRDGYPPAKSLMPLAFGSLLGGLPTLIGTPPNLIIALHRQERIGEAFGMFDFAPVGVAVAGAGVLFLVLVGWRLLPLKGREKNSDRPFEIEEYVTEASVPKKSKGVGATVAEIEEMADDDVTVLGIVRKKKKHLAPSATQRVQSGDALILRGDPDALKDLVDSGGLKLAGERKFDARKLKSEDIDLVEAVIGSRSRLTGRTPASIRLRTVHGVNLLAVARQGKRIRERLADIKLASGDVLLLQGPADRIAEAMTELQLLPLAERELGIGKPRRLLAAAGIFGVAVAAVMSGLLPVHVAFVVAAAAMIVTDLVKPDEAYQAIDWPVIVLLAAMFPVGAALDNTGGTALVAGWILTASEGLGVAWVLLILLVATMILSDVINNNATAILMAPIATILAERLGASADPFLMAVAVGASCAFLTPIGHQSNALVMEPGGYKFGDYWRMGLPLEVIIVVVAIPMLLWVWPP